MAGSMTLRVRREGAAVVLTRGSGPDAVFSGPWLLTTGACLLGAGFWDPNFVLALPLLLATVAHELGHAAMAHRLGVRVDRVEIGLLRGRVLFDRPPDPAYARVVAAGPALHALAGLATMSLAAFGSRAWLVIGGFVLVHAVTNLAPSTNGDGGPNDGQILMELWLSRRPLWVRGAVVLGLSGGMLGLAVVGTVGGGVPWLVIGLLALVGGLGAVAGVDLVRQSRHHRGG